MLQPTKAARAELAAVVDAIGGTALTSALQQNGEGTAQPHGAAQQEKLSAVEQMRLAAQQAVQPR